MGIKLTAAQIIALRNVVISPATGKVHVTAKGQTMNALRRHGIVCEEGNTLTRFGNAVRIELSDPAIIASKGHMTVVSRMLPTDLDEYTPSQPVECIHDKPMSSCFECTGDTPEFHAAHSAPEDAQDAPVSASEPEDAAPARVRVSGPCEWTRTDSEGEKHECAGGMGFIPADAVHMVRGKRLCAYHSPKDTTPENLAQFGWEDARPASVWVRDWSGYWIEYAVIPNGDPHRVDHFLNLAKAIPAYKSTAHVRYIGDPTPSPVKDAPMASEPVSAPLPSTTPLMDSVASLNRVWIRMGKSATVHISKGRGESICGRSGGQSVKMFPEYVVCKRCERIQEKDAKRARKIAYGAMRDAELDRMTYGGAPYTQAEEERDMADYTRGYDWTTDADIAILTADGFVEATPEILAQEIGALNAEIEEERTPVLWHVYANGQWFPVEWSGAGQPVSAQVQGTDTYVSGIEYAHTVPLTGVGTCPLCMTAPSTEEFPNERAYASGTENANDYVMDEGFLLYGPEWQKAFRSSYAYSMEIQEAERGEVVPAEITVECSLSIKVDGIMINLGWHTFTLSESESVLRTVPELYGARNGEWRRPGNADWASVIVVDAYNEL